MDFEQQYQRWKNGEISRTDLVAWVQQNMRGTERNRALTRVMSETAVSDLEESGVTPGAAGTVATSAVSGARGAAQAANALRSVNPNTVASTLSPTRMVAGTGAMGAAALGAHVLSGGDDDTADGMGPAERAIREAEVSGAEITDAMLAAFQRENPQAFAVWASEGAEPAATSAGGSVPAGFEQMSPAQALQAAAMEAIRRGFEDPISAGFESAVGLANAARQMALLEQEGAVQLSDGTLITQEMLNHADPALRLQYQQAFLNRQNEVENEARSLLNAYALEDYTLQRQQALDRDSTVIAQHNAELSSVRERLMRDEIDIRRAMQEVERILSGQQESRARAELETRTLLEAAPYGTVGGKTSFTGGDLGAGATATLRQLGHANPEQATAIRFPGTINLDPAGRMAEYDRALGVDRALPEVPGVSVTDADIPRAPQLQGTGGIPLPAMQPPVAPRAIDIPPELLAMMGVGAAPSPVNHDAALQQRRAFRE